jgi:cbb3-type cytochrome oxidase maturation protein
MSVILILMLASLTVALAFLAGFIWAVKTGQFEDTCTPAMRILTEEEPRTPETQPKIEDGRRDSCDGTKHLGELRAD